MPAKDQQDDLQEKRSQFYRRWLPLLVEAWLFGVIVTFLIVRIVGSGTAQRLLHAAGR